MLVTLFASSSALASDNLEVNLEGSIDFQAAVRNQNGLQGDDYLTKNRKNSTFFNQAGVKVDVSNETDCGLKYGATITLSTTSKLSYLSKNGTFLFLESDYGRLEAGSGEPAEAKMSVSGYNIAAASGDGWTRYLKLNPKIHTIGDDKTSAYLGDFDDYAPVYIGNLPDHVGESPRSLSLYTPKINGVQIGVSYTPDTLNSGTKGISGIDGKKNYYDQNGVAYKAEGVGVKDLVGVGINFEHNLSDGVDIKLGAGYQEGAAKGKITHIGGESNEEELKLNKHRLYNFGAVVSYGNWSVGGSYADAGKSLTSSKFHFGERKNKFYTAALAYNQGPVAVSLTYLRNEKYNNKLNTYTLGTDYQLAPGLKPYAEVTAFNFNNKGYVTGEEGGLEQQNRKYKGMLYILGTKITF